MRASVYIPTGEFSSNPNITPATRADVDVENLDALLTKLADEAPERTRVVAFTPNGSYHYILADGHWVPKMQVIVA